MRRNRSKVSGKNTGPNSSLDKLEMSLAMAVCDEDENMVDDEKGLFKSEKPYKVTVTTKDVL